MKDTNRSLLIVVLIVIFIFIGVFASYQRAPKAQIQPATSESVGLENLPAAAPDVAFLKSDSTEFKLRTLKGKPILLHFWASWCPPCIEETPLFLEFAKWAKTEAGVEVLAVSEDDGWNEVRSFMKKMGLNSLDAAPMQILKDDQSHSSKKFGTDKLPESYFIDTQFNVVRKFVGPQRWTSYDIKDWVIKHAR